MLELHPHLIRAVVDQHRRDLYATSRSRGDQMRTRRRGRAVSRLLVDAASS